MARVSSDSLFDYYQHHIIADEVAQYYYFQVVRGEETVCYNRLGVVEEPEAEASFRITPGFHTPEWAKGVVMYDHPLHRPGRLGVPPGLRRLL